MYNEALRFDKSTFFDFADQYSYINWYFINDGSTDQTYSVLTKIKQERPLSVQIITFAENKGKAEAVRAGVLEAYNQNIYSHIGFIDGDLQIPLDQINNLYSIIKYDKLGVALSTRELKKNLSFFNYRSIISNCMIIVNQRILDFKTPIMDSQCGCKLFSVDLVEFLFSKAFISKWLFDMEILLRLKKRENFEESQIKQVRLDRINKSKNSKFKLYQNLNLIIDLLRIKQCYK